jgi:hypothetical protein
MMLLVHPERVRRQIIRNAKGIGSPPFDLLLFTISALVEENFRRGG